MFCLFFVCFFFSSRRRHTRLVSDWSSDVCSSDLTDSDPATFSRLYAQYWLRGNPLELGGQFSVAAYHAIQRESKVLQELAARSEERRVGKECRSRWASDH